MFLDLHVIVEASPAFLPLRERVGFGRQRLEAACTRALEIGARSYTSVSSILKTNRDRQRPATATDEPAIVHSNIRGPRYFN